MSDFETLIFAPSGHLLPNPTNDINLEDDPSNPRVEPLLIDHDSMEDQTQHPLLSPNTPTTTLVDHTTIRTTSLNGNISTEVKNQSFSAQPKKSSYYRHNHYPNKQQCNANPPPLSSYPFDDLPPSLELQSSLPYKLFQLLENPKHSIYSQCIHIVIFLSIVVSTMLVILESLPQFHDRKFTIVFTMIESVIILLLSSEYIARMYAWCGTGWNIKKMFYFIKAPMNLVDLLSFSPFYIEMTLFLLGLYDERVQILSVFKVLRLFRLLRLMRYSEKLNLIFQAIHKSMDVLASIIVFVVFAMVISSTLMHYLERGYYDPVKKNYFRPNGTTSPFNSIPSSMWWSISVLTTIGMSEEFAPITAQGKVVASTIMMMGVLLIALPSLTISKSYKEVRARYELQLLTSSGGHGVKDSLDGQDSDHSMLVRDQTEELMTIMEKQIRVLTMKQEETQKMLQLLTNNLDALREIQSSSLHKQHLLRPTIKKR